jgi:hypothetical protein
MLPATRDERKSIAMEVFGDDVEEMIDSFPAYFNVYDSLTSPRIQNVVVPVDEPMLKSHVDVLNLVRNLKASAQSTRCEIRNREFDSRNLISTPVPSVISDMDDAINIAVHAMLMIDCAARACYSKGYEVDGFKPVGWEDQESLTDFVKRIFPLDPVQNPPKPWEVRRNRHALKGWKLKKRAHVVFRPTDNLVEHLLYDPHDNSVRLFHHTAFLKAHLRRSAAKPVDCGIAESLAM